MFVYTLFTLISSGILYGAFRKRMDASAVYFLISELCMGITCGTLFLININTVAPISPWTGIPILSALGAELAILFSILSLTNKIQKKWFFLAASLIVLITISLETLRTSVQPRTIILMVSLCLTGIFTASFFICRFRLPMELRRNQFVKWLTWLELGMVSYGVVRILGYFSPTPIRPWDTPNTIALIIFSFYVVLGTFRYIAYIGLRVSWINPINPAPNSLNKSLAHAIDEKDQLLRGLIASNRVIGISALASSLAHQLSQPLTTIALRADTIRRDLPKNSSDKNYEASLDEISTQSTKLAELVKNLRRLFGSRSYEFTPVHLPKIIDEIIEIVEPTLQSKNITLNREYVGSPVINGDSIQLQQVLINLLNNSIDELSQRNTENKSIAIRVEEDEKYARLTIKDNGAGIALDTIPTIFDLYKTTKKDGLGVGLWLCKEIIERHHGHISAANDSVGGAIFKIQIPLDSSKSK
jgi:signal transduction histidine kinase